MVNYPIIWDHWLSVVGNYDWQAEYLKITCLLGGVRLIGHSCNQLKDKRRVIPVCCRCNYYWLFLIAKEGESSFKRSQHVLSHVERCWDHTVKRLQQFREQKKCREDVETKGVSNGLDIGFQQMLRPFNRALTRWWYVGYYRHICVLLFLMFITSRVTEPDGVMCISASCERSKICHKRRWNHSLRVISADFSAQFNQLCACKSSGQFAKGNLFTLSYSGETMRSVLAR